MTSRGKHDFQSEITMEDRVRKNSIKTYWVTIDPNDKRATKLIEALKVMDFLVIEEIPYSTDYVGETQT